MTPYHQTPHRISRQRLECAELAPAFRPPLLFDSGAIYPLRYAGVSSFNPSEMIINLHVVSGSLPGISRIVIRPTMLQLHPRSDYLALLACWGGAEGWR